MVQIYNKTIINFMDENLLKTMKYKQENLQTLNIKYTNEGLFLFE